ETGKRLLRAIKQAPGALERDNGVVEGRFGGTIRDRLDFLELLAHAGFNRRDEVLVLDLVERRIVIRERAFFKQRIIGGSSGGHGGDLRAKKKNARDEGVEISHRVGARSVKRGRRGRK